ncbi:MAG: zinc-ribbon domain-containing protein [Suilimivivens sp.]
MFCSNCGSKLLEDAVFCSECGKKIDELIDNGVKQKEIEDKKRDSSVGKNIEEMQEEKKINGEEISHDDQCPEIINSMEDKIKFLTEELYGIKKKQQIQIQNENKRLEKIENALREIGRIVETLS